MIQYRLEFKMYDTELPSNVSYVPILSDSVELDVTSLTSIDDRRALRTLCNIIEAGLMPTGSTVLERRAIAEAPHPGVCVGAITQFTDAGEII